MSDWTDIPGWLTPGEGMALQIMAIGKTVLELGSFFGRSTVAMAEVARRVTSIDSHVGDKDVGPANTLGHFRKNLEEHGVADRVEVIVGRIEDEAGKLEPGSYDLVFIDSQHDADSVARDTKIAMKLVKPGGRIVWHDWNQFGVRLGVHRSGLVPQAIRETLVWLSVPQN